MYSAQPKLPCVTCPLEGEEEIEAREERIERRRARVEKNITVDRGEEEVVEEEDARPETLGGTTYSSSGSDTSDSSGREKEYDGEEEDGDEGEDEGDEFFYPPVPATPAEDALVGEGVPEEGSESSTDSDEDQGPTSDPFYIVQDGGEEVDPYKERFNGQKEQSRRNIAIIMRDGDTWVTNVKVAVQAREYQRRERVKALRKERFEKLRQEAAECLEAYKELEQGWNIKAEKVLPLELYEKIQEQQRAADRLLERKDVQIDELRNILDETDWEFEEVLGFYQKDIVLMGDRIDDLMDALFSSFVNEFALIEEYVQTEETEMLGEYQTQWEEMMSKYEQAERDSLEERQNQALNRFASIGEKYQTVKEEMRHYRRQLEDDYRTLVLLFENFKFASLLNTEKLDYNLKVVRRREQENLKMRSSLKRAVLKYRDVFNSLRDEFSMVVTNAKKEAKDVIKEANRLQEQNAKALQTLFHMARVDYSKFMDCWIGSEDEGRRKLLLLLDIQEFVFKKMLGLTLPKTDLSTLDLRPKEVQAHILQLDYDEEMQKAERGDPSAWGRKTATSSGNSRGPETATSASGRGGDFDWSGGTVAGSKMELPFSAGSSSIQNQNLGNPKKLKSTPSFLLDWSPSLNLLPEPETDPIFQRKVMNELGRVIGEETGFLLEEKLRKMLTPMMKSERILVQFDAVLSVLGIKTLEDMQLLARYMIRHCTVMKGILAKWDDVSTPILESMQVSLDEIPSNFTSVETVTLERLNKQISLRLLEVEVEKEQPSHQLKPIQLPRILYCDELQMERKSIQENLGEQFAEDEVSGEGSEVIRGDKNTGSPGDEEEEGEGSERISHSTGSMDTPEGCRRRTLSFKTDESMVMTWYKQSSTCKCDRAGGVCICDDSEEVKEGQVDQGLLPQTGTSQADSSSDTASIPSHPTSSVGSDEFLYIPPNDVLRALAGFLREFNAKTKKEKPTINEIVTQKLSKLRFPSTAEIKEYWTQFVPMAQHFDTDGFWDSLLQIFTDYHTMLKERNRELLEVEAIGKQNEELARLLRSHMQKFGVPGLDLNRLTLPYCQN